VTIVTRTRALDKQLDQVPRHLRDKAILWIEFVETLGLREVRKRPGFHDEPLKGQRKGQRSIRLNNAYRLIYREVRSGIEILLLEVSKHEY
jgi:toxin HigB-1